MTGTLNSYSSLKSIGAINFYYTTSEEEEPHTEPVTLITGNDIVKYERRMLLYPYMPRSNERPLVVAYLEKVEVLKIFVPKMCTRIRVVDKRNQEQDIEGTFMDVTDPASMLEYNIDKVVTLMNVSSEEAATTYFSTIHQDPLVDAHREDFEIVPGHIQERSLVNVYLTKLSNRPRTAEGLGSILWSNDESMWFMGTKLNEIHNRLSIYPTGVKAHSSFLKDDFSIDFIGDSVSGSDTVYLDTETTDTKYRRWAYDNDRYNFPKRHIIWGRFRWKEWKDPKQYSGYWLSGYNIETVEITKTWNDVHGVIATYYNTIWTFDCTYANNTDIDNLCKFKDDNTQGIFWNVEKNIWIYVGYGYIFRPIYRTRAEAEKGNQFNNRESYLAWANS